MAERTPGAVFEQAVTALMAGDLDGWLTRCHADIVAEFPFAPAGRPRRLDGTAALAEYLRALQGQVSYERVTAWVAHETLDPATVVVEWSVQGRVAASAANFQMDYVVVLTVVDGLMTRFRDYWNPLTVQQTIEAR